MSDPHIVELPEFPVFDLPQIEPWPINISWSEAVAQMAPFRQAGMLYDDVGWRFRDKNPEPFVLD